MKSKWGIAGVLLLITIPMTLVIWFVTNPYFILRNEKVVKLHPLSSTENGKYVYYASQALDQYGISMDELQPARVIHESGVDTSNYDWRAVLQEKNGGLGTVEVKVKLTTPVIVSLRAWP